MRISGDCVLEEQSVENIQGRLKKITAGIVTIGLLVGIGTCIPDISLQDRANMYCRLQDESILWSVPAQMGNAAKQESIRVYTGIQTEDNLQKTGEEALAVVQQSERTDLETVQSLVQQPAVMEPTISGSQDYGNTIPQEEVIQEEIPTEVPEEVPVSEYVYYQGFKIDQENMICGFDPAKSEMEDGYLELPSEQCVGIRKGTFTGVGDEIYELYIPENIENIENGAFSELSELTWIETSEAGFYAAKDGILYWGTELAAFPAGRVGIFKMPEDVTAIRESAFANTKLDKIDMRHCSLISYDEGMFGGTAGCMIMEDEDGV